MGGPFHYEICEGRGGPFHCEICGVVLSTMKSVRGWVGWFFALLNNFVFASALCSVIRGTFSSGPSYFTASIDTGCVHVLRGRIPIFFHRGHKSPCFSIVRFHRLQSNMESRVILDGPRANRLLLHLSNSTFLSLQL